MIGHKVIAYDFSFTFKALSRTVIQHTQEKDDAKDCQIGCRRTCSNTNSSDPLNGNSDKGKAQPQTLRTQ